MKDRLSWNQLTRLFAVAVLLMFGWHSQASADMISTEQLVAEHRADSQRAELQAFFTRDDVRAQLIARGVDALDAERRVNNMNAAELSQLQARIDELPAGEGVLETVLFLLVIFMLLDIAGVTDIFPGL
jgi:TolA-binding protein